MVGNACLMFFLLYNACLIGFKIADILNHINGEAVYCMENIDLTFWFHQILNFPCASVFV